jgi:pimeloyl-ACP methyl ester carboxylesterase
VTDAPTGLYVEELPPEGGGAARLVVAVHGSMDRHRSFFPLRAKLRDHHVVVYDRRGYFRSREVRPPARGVADHAADLIDVLGGRPAVVIGHSYGGDVALAAAAASPLVRALVVFEAPLAWLPWWHPAGVPHSRMLFGGEDPGDAAEAFVSRVIGAGRLERLGPTMRAGLRADGPALVTELDALRLDGQPFDPGAIRVPVVLARGSASADRHRQGTGWLAARLPDCEVHVVDGAGHNAHLSHPEAVAALVRRAVERAWPTGGVSS